MEAPTLTLVLEVLAGDRAGQHLKVTLPAQLGRATDASIHLPDVHLSGHHGALSLDNGVIRYTDRGSSNGSRHVRDGQRTALQGRCMEAELWDGDLLELGDREHPVVLKAHVNDPLQGCVVAVRPIAQIDEFADRLKAQPGRLSVLFRHSAELGKSIDLQAVLEVAARLVFELLPRATHLAVALKERAGRFPVVFAQNRAGQATKIPISRTILRAVLDQSAGVLLTNAASEFSSSRSIVQAGLASTMSVPLWTGANIRGVIQVDNRDAPGLFGAEDLELLAVAAAHISFAAENARLVGRLRLAEARLERENRYLKAQAASDVQDLIGETAAMRAVAESVDKVKDTRVPVLILGETGTGKEVVARRLHYNSRRSEALFIPQNCSALPEGLLESELFGHVRGAFTGADRDKKGLFDLADGGTVFLDEIGEMPLLLQAKLLRVLQEGEIWPVGAPRPKRIDVRIVSATHRDLDEMVRTGSFRQDLYYRLHVFPIQLPPLRARRDDIPMLARYFLKIYARELGRAVSGFTPDALDRLRSYDWPGNVRELQNELQRVLIQRAEGDLVLASDLSARVLGQTDMVDTGDVAKGTLKEMLDSVERVLLSRALRNHGGNKTQAAKTLGITREGLHKKLARFGMNK